MAGAKPARPKARARAVVSSTRQAALDIIAATDRLCTEHLDAEYAELCRKLVDELARKRPSPLARGEPRVWAGAVLYTVGGVNFLFDKTQRPHWTTDELARASGVGKSTLSAKATIIRKALGIVPLDPEFCRRELLADHPLAWMVEVDGILIDARMLPPEVQAELRRRGMIPDLTWEALNAHEAAPRGPPRSSADHVRGRSRDHRIRGHGDRDHPPHARPRRYPDDP